jgi:3',5'-cyclic AMP phosphodiesterase CpdA
MDPSTNLRRRGRAVLDGVTGTAPGSVSTLLHISDLHFGPPFLTEVAEAVVEQAQAVDPDVVVVSGDLTQRARTSQYREAREYLERFDRPVVVTPGNHDVPLYRFWERLLAPYRRYRHYVSAELNTVTELPGLVIVALNSTRRFTFTNGRIRLWQLEFARRAFQRAPSDSARVVVTHHHLAPPPDFEGGSVMPRAKRALEWFTRLGVDLILAGHMHRSYIGNSLDFFPGDLERRGIVVVQSGTTTSRRGRGRERLRNTLNVIRIDDRVIRVAHQMWITERARFMPVSEHVFPRGAKQYFEPYSSYREEIEFP